MVSILYYSSVPAVHSLAAEIAQVNHLNLDKIKTKLTEVHVCVPNSIAKNRLTGHKWP